MRPLCRYTLANVESRKGVRQGDKVFQVGFGGGTLPVHATSVAACNANRVDAEIPRSEARSSALAHGAYPHRVHAWADCPFCSVQ